MAERSLLHRAPTLDDAALGEIFDTYYPLLYRYIFHHVHHQATAEDLTAEVFPRVLEQLADGRGPTRHLNAWLYRLAHNLVVDESSRRTHRDHDPLDEGTAVAEENVEAPAEMALWRQQARAALVELTPTSVRYHRRIESGRHQIGRRFWPVLAVFVRWLYRQSRRYLTNGGDSSP